MSTLDDDTTLTITFTETVTMEREFRTTVGELRTVLAASGEDRDNGEPYINTDGTLNLPALREGAQPSDAWDDYLAELATDLTIERHVHTEREIASITD